MKVRFRAPEKIDPIRDRGICMSMAPARRPGVPRWRWYVFLTLLALLFLWAGCHFLRAALSAEGRCFAGYPGLELRAPVRLAPTSVTSPFSVAVKL